MFYVRKKWIHALITCVIHAGCLVKVTPENIHDVTYIMGENRTGIRSLNKYYIYYLNLIVLLEINHIWIGGRLSEDGQYFFWVKDKEVIPRIEKTDIDNFPPWYDNIYEQERACLNLDRENHNRPMFYGVDCEYPQYFLCYGSKYIFTTTCVSQNIDNQNEPNAKTLLLIFWVIKIVNGS